MAAPFAYFDTSVVVKRYVREQSSTVAQRLLRRYRCLSATILPVEVMSALHRRRAAGDLAPADFAAIVSRVGEDRRRWELVPITGAVLALAEDLVGRHALRTLDAIHVAAALTFRNVSGLRVPFVTADTRQRDAADPAGLSVVWVAG
jgi:predicted nucleic acid-binding protein